MTLELRKNIYIDLWMIELIYSSIVVSPACWQSGFIRAHPMVKGRLYCLVSRVVVERKGNVTRSLNSLLAPSAKLLSAQKWFQACSYSHTLYPPTPWKMKQFGIIIPLELEPLWSQQSSCLEYKSLRSPGKPHQARSRQRCMCITVLVGNWVWRM